MRRKYIISFLICVAAFEIHALRIECSKYPADMMGYHGKHMATTGFMLSLTQTKDVSYSFRFSPRHIQQQGEYHYEYLSDCNLLIVVRDGSFPYCYIYRINDKRREGKISGNTIRQICPISVFQGRIILKNGSNGKIENISSWKINDVVFVCLKNKIRTEGSLLIVNLTTGEITCKSVISQALTAGNDYLMPIRISAPYCPEEICRVIAPPVHESIADGVKVSIFRNNTKIADKDFLNSFFYRYKGAPYYEDSPRFESVADAFFRKTALLHIGMEKFSKMNDSAIFSHPGVPDGYIKKMNDFTMDVTGHDLKAGIVQWKRSIYAKELFIISRLYKSWQDESAKNILKKEKTDFVLKVKGGNRDERSDILKRLKNGKPV